MNKLIYRSFFNAAATAVYIMLVTIVMRNGGRIFGQQMNNFFGPIAFLMLFVLSAAITASLILGKPVLMYLSGSKSEAVKLFFYTLGWLAVGIVILFLTNIK